VQRAKSEWRETLAHLATLDRSECVNDAGVTAGDATRCFTVPDAPEGWMLEERVYGHGGEYELDLLLYRPRDTTELRPGVIFVHGGALRSGFPEMYATQARALAERGYVAASLDYRVYPEALWPAALEDVKCGLRWMRANASAIGVDPDRIGYVGGSAGGYLGALAIATGGRFEGEGGWHDVSSEVAAAVLFYPLTDTRWPTLEPDIQGVVRDFIGTEDVATWAEASPSTYLGAPVPPTLVITGTRDREVPVAMVEEYVRRLEDQRADVELVVFPDRAHAFDYAEEDWRACVDLVAAFFDRTLR
jgi:acetyl esterase/lipase